MNESLDPNRAAYNRVHFRLKSYEDAFEIKPVTIPLEIVAAGQRHFMRVMARLSKDTQRIQPFRAESYAIQLAYLRGEFSDARAQGIGISQGEYASVARTQVNKKNRFIATDGIIDCQGLVLVARDAHGQVKQTLLAHIDAKTSVARMLPELLAHMPEGSKVEATLLSSPSGYNYYLQSDLMEALNKASQISRIRHAFDAAHTIAVDTVTGHILTASGKYEPRSSVKKINQWPIDIYFPEFTNESGLQISNLAEKFFRLERQVPAFGLHLAYDGAKGFIDADPLAKFILQRQHNDGQLDTYELHDILEQIGATLNSQVQLAYLVNETGRAKFTIKTLEGMTLGDFVSNKISPELGNSGIIKAPNTPPAPGRGPATDTMSPLSGKAPTGRQ